MKAPCQDCQDRQEGCHAGCERYADFKAEKAKAKPKFTEADYYKSEKTHGRRRKK